MVNLFLHHSAINIVGAEAQGYLCHPGRHHDPVGLDVRKIIKHQARDGHVLQVHKSRGLMVVDELTQFRVGGMKRERDEGLESMRLVLEVAELA